MAKGSAPTPRIIVEMSAPGGGSTQHPIAAVCKYAGQEYSGGSQVEMPSGDGHKVVKTCNGQAGEWV